LKGLKPALGLELLKPTRIYVRSVLEIARRVKLRGVAHITGGGITENLPRVFPKGMSALIQRRSWKPQPIFKIVQREGDVDDAGMHRTFNMGIGMILLVARTDAQKALNRLDRMGERAFIIGEVVKDSTGPQVLYDPPLK
jgi:phosphoribosylformylglycinamidine cyclo-ligase